MLFFTKKETKIVGLILLFIFVVSLLNFRVAFRRARDNQRKNDLGDINKAVNQFKEDFGFYPLSIDGRIRGCGNHNKQTLPQDFDVCEWGEEYPRDPQWQLIRNYLYLSTGSHYQIFAALEGEDEDEYNLKIKARGLMCGKAVCNYGVSQNRVPLDKSLEEYENELERK